MSAELFVELRCEELPAGMVRPALTGLRKGLLELLKGIEHGEVRTWATPRRLAVAVSDVITARPLVERVLTGPPAARAFVDGQPTKAAIGFARGKGVEVSDLEVVEGPKGPVIAARVTEGGDKTHDLIAAGLPGVVLGVPFKKSMEWHVGGMRFGRPLHGICALFEGEVIDVEVNGIASGNQTAGHRHAPDTVFSFSSSEEWEQGLRARFVEPNLEGRKTWIRELLDQASAGLEADPIAHEALLEEVTHLVEWPVLVIGAFDEELLDLPPRLLEKSMTAHQRYFPLHRGGKLLSHFAIISNNPWGDDALVAEGNARVLRARFYDARFFFSEDRKQTLETHGKQLASMVWIKGLGTMADRQDRIAKTARRMASLTGADPELAEQAGHLCKSDLTTQMVGEFPDLQGHMGRLYAKDQGKSHAVAMAIEEHYRPAFADDAPPETEAGAAVALADRLDTLVGCFSVGMVPKGSGDPQGLRRAASGVLRILEHRGIRVDLRALFLEAAHSYHLYANKRENVYRFDLVFKDMNPEGQRPEVEELLDKLVAFTLTRFKAGAVASGATGDLVDAVVSVSEGDVVVLRGKVRALEALVGTERFSPILQTFKRVLKITQGQSFTAPDRSALTVPAERDLAQAVDSTGGEVLKAVEHTEYATALSKMLDLQAPVAAFFDAVLVDDPDPNVKARRMGLLLEVAAIFRSLADFTRISTR